MTGIFFRVERDGKWRAIEMENLTREELHRVLTGKENSFLLGCLERACVMLSLYLDFLMVEEEEQDQ